MQCKEEVKDKKIVNIRKVIIVFELIVILFIEEQLDCMVYFCINGLNFSV